MIHALAATLLGALSFPKTAIAAEPAGETPIVAEGACLSSGALSAVVQRHLRGRGLPAGARASVTQLEQGARIEFFLGPTMIGSRVIEAEAVGCPDLVEAVGLAVSVLIDAAFEKEASDPVVAAPPHTAVGDARAEPSEASPPREHPVLDRAVASPTPPSVATPPKALPARVGASLELGGGAGLTAQPGATGALMVDVGLGGRVDRGARPELSGRLGLMVAFPSTSMLSDAPLVSSVVAPRLDLCIGVLGSSLRARACGAALAGALLTDEAGDYPRVAAGARIDGRWMMTPRVGLQASADALANLAPAYVGHLLSDGSYSDLQELGPAALSFQGGVVVEIL